MTQNRERLAMRMRRVARRPGVGSVDWVEDCVGVVVGWSEWPLAPFASSSGSFLSSAIALSGYGCEAQCNESEQHMQMVSRAEQDRETASSVVAMLVKLVSVRP